VSDTGPVWLTAGYQSRTRMRGLFNNSRARRSARTQDGSAVSLLGAPLVTLSWKPKLSKSDRLIDMATTELTSSSVNSSRSRSAPSDLSQK
jgi:hypothetical protein